MYTEATMIFGRKKTDSSRTSTDRFEDPRRGALERLARFASEDDARTAKRDAARVDALRRAHADSGSERLIDPGADDPALRTALEAEIADAVEGLGRTRPG